MPNYFLCKPDIAKPEFLKSMTVKVTETLFFIDRILPPIASFAEHESFTMSYFVQLHKSVKAYNVHNYQGARIPLKHNNIKVDIFRSYLSKFNYPHIHILQFVEFGFPLGLWTDAYLEPCKRNHSSAYSFYTFLDEFINSEISKVGLTGPFDKAPFDPSMLSPLMTARKKPTAVEPSLMLVLECSV